MRDFMIRDSQLWDCIPAFFKALLVQYSDLEFDLKRIRSKIANLRELGGLPKIGDIKVFVDGGNKNSPVENFVFEVLDQEEKARDIEKQIAATLDELTAITARLPRKICALVIDLRFIYKKSVQTICDETYYSPTQIRRLLMEGVVELENIAQKDGL